MAAAFPGTVFGLSSDPAFDALDIGVAGRLLSRGGAFALQNAEGLGLNLAAAGPLTRVHAGHEGSGPETGASHRRLVPQRPGEKRKVRHFSTSGAFRSRGKVFTRGDGSDGEFSGDDARFGDDERDAGEVGMHIPKHMLEHNRGNLACTLPGRRAGALLVHAGGRFLNDINVSRLVPRRGGQTWQLVNVARCPGGIASARAFDMDCDDAANHHSGTSSRRLVHIAAEVYDDPSEFAWIATRSRNGAAVFRLREAASGSADTRAAAGNAMLLTGAGEVRPCPGATASSIVLNPHWGGEAALLDSTGQVKIWNAGCEEDTIVQGLGIDENAQAVLSRAPPYAEAVSTMRRLALGYGQLAWGMHPRTLLCAQAYRISVLDVRGPGPQELLRMPCASLAQAGRFFSICSGAASGASHEIAAVTSSLVCIFDIRQPSLPMLRWLHHQEYDPPRHLSICPIHSAKDERDEELGARMVITGNERWGEVICYQYGPAAADAALLALEQPRKLTSVGDTNAFPPIHEPDNYDRRAVDPASATQLTRPVRRLCGLGFSLFQTSGAECTDEAGDETVQDEPHLDDKMVGVVVQMSQTGEIFAHGLHDGQDARAHPSECKAPELQYGNPAFRGWIDSKWLQRETRPEDGVPGSGEGAATAEHGGGADRSGGAQRKDAGEEQDKEGHDDMVDFLVDSAGRLCVDGRQVGASAQPVNGGEVKASGGMQRSSGKEQVLVPHARVSLNWTAATGVKRGDIEPWHVSATGRPLIPDYRDFGKMFEFGVGLRGFDGKVVEGVRLPDPPERKVLRWVCEACGLRTVARSKGSSRSEGANGLQTNKLHVCANCNSGWHAKCVARLFAQRGESDLYSRKVPVITVPHWICPQCTFYAEDRERSKRGAVTRKQWRDRLRRSKVPIAVNRNEPCGGVWGTADAFVHDVDKAFQGLGVGDPASSGGAIKKGGARKKGRIMGGSSVIGSVKSVREDSACQGETNAVEESLREQIGEKLLQFVQWPPKTMLEILVYVRQNLGMASVSMAALAQCLLEMRSLADPKTGATIILSEGHEAALTNAAALLADIPVSEGVEVIAGGQQNASRDNGGMDDLCEIRGLPNGSGNTKLLYQLCCYVYRASSSIEGIVQEWKSTASRDMAMDGKPQHRADRQGTRRLGVNILSDEAVRDIFLQRPKDQYQDVPNGDGTYSTRMLFDKYNRKMPFVKRRAGRPNAKPDGPDSLMQILAKKYNVRLAAIYSIWMRTSYRSVTDSIKGHLVVKTQEELWAESAEQTVAAFSGAAVQHGAESDASDVRSVGSVATGTAGKSEEVGGHSIVGGEAESVINASNAPRGSGAPGGDIEMRSREDTKDAGKQEQAGDYTRGSGVLPGVDAKVGLGTPIFRRAQDAEDGDGGFLNVDASISSDFNRSVHVSSAKERKQNVEQETDDSFLPGLGAEDELSAVLQRLQAEWDAASAAEGHAARASATPASAAFLLGRNKERSASPMGRPPLSSATAGAPRRMPAGIMKTPLSPRSKGKRVSMSLASPALSAPLLPPAWSQGSAASTPQVKSFQTLHPHDHSTRKAAAPERFSTGPSSFATPHGAAFQGGSGSSARNLDAGSLARKDKEPGSASKLATPPSSYAVARRRRSAMGSGSGF